MSTTTLPTFPEPSDVDRLRCHWIRTTDAPEGVGPWALIPGCTAMATNPEGGFDCDALWSRLQIQIQHRKDADAEVSRLRGRCRTWARAAAAAMEAVTGRPTQPGVWQPEELERAARDAPEARR